MPNKNLLMFSIDDMRSVNNWGHFTPLVSTPNLDRLANMGTTFEHAVTQVPLCNPSRTSVLTGLQPSRTGVLDNSVPWFDRVDPADTLPAVLKAAGAYVAMYGKNFHGDPIDPGDQAIMFNEFLYPETDGAASQVIHDGVFHNTPFRSGRYGGSPDNLRDEQTVDAAIDFLQGAGDLSKPFFLSVGITKPHLDWWVPPQFYDRYDQAEIRAALQASLADGTIIPGAGEYFDVPPMSTPLPVHKQMAGNMDLWVDYIHAYLASISYADAKIGQVLDALEDDPALAADTSIVLWSDHGYHLGDKDRWNKFTHWHEATEVPFIIVDPDRPGGQTAEQIVSLVDIFPTVLGLMGIAPPGGLGLQGNSLLPIVQNADVAWYNPAEGKGVALTTIYGSVSVRAHVPGKGDLRYTVYPDGTEELYKLTQDPDEHVNRLNYNTGKGLTAADDELRTLMRGLLDDQAADAGIRLSDGSHAVLGTGADELIVSTKGFGNNTLAGAGGDDTYVVYKAATITEQAGGGFDSIVLQNPTLETTFKLPAHVEMIQVQHSFTGNDANNWISAIAGGGVLKGAGGKDTIRANDGAYSIDGGSGDDRLFGEDQKDTIVGGAGNDLATGYTAGDKMSGGTGNDTLRGEAGDDTLAGDAGVDRLEGALGNDVFDFNAAGESTSSASDTIVGFTGPGASAGDRLDLSGIDANTQASGNQAFKLGGTGAGTVRFTEAAGDTVVLGNTDADATIELRVVIDDGGTSAAAYTGNDVIL